MRWRHMSIILGICSAAPAHREAKMPNFGVSMAARPAAIRPASVEDSFLVNTIRLQPAGGKPIRERRSKARQHALLVQRTKEFPRQWKKAVEGASCKHACIIIDTSGIKCTAVTVE